MTLIPLEAAGHVAHEATMPAWGYGLFILVIFLVALQLVRGVGQGQPTS